jgi:hypothetical protein
MQQTTLSPSQDNFLPPVPCSDAHCRQLENQITELSAHIHAATWRLLELIREFDDAHGWAGPGLNSCAHWLNWKCGFNLATAREKVRVAHALKDLPLISDKFRRGELCYSFPDRWADLFHRSARPAPAGCRRYAVQRERFCASHSQQPIRHPHHPRNRQMPVGR